MNPQVELILKKMITQYKDDVKCFIDQVDRHMAARDDDYVKLTNCAQTVIDNQNMMRTLLKRLWE